MQFEFMRRQSERTDSAYRTCVVILRVRVRGGGGGGGGGRERKEDREGIKGGKERRRQGKEEKSLFQRDGKRQNHNATSIYMYIYCSYHTQSQVTNMEPFVDALLVEVMTTWPEASDLLSDLEVTHTHHTTEAGGRRVHVHTHHTTEAGGRRVHVHTHHTTEAGGRRVHVHTHHTTEAGGRRVNVHTHTHTTEAGGRRVHAHTPHN